MSKAQVSINPQLYKDIDNSAAEMAYLLAQNVADAAKSNYTFEKQTGELQDSIETERQGNTALLKVESPYAAYVEYGHLAADGSVVSAKPFVRPAIKKVMRAANLRKLFAEIAQKKGF